MIFALISVASGAALSFTGEHETSDYGSFVPTAAANPRELALGNMMIPLILVALLFVAAIGVFLIQDDEPQATSPIFNQRMNRIAARPPKVGLNNRVQNAQDAALANVDALVKKKQDINKKVMAAQQMDDKLALEQKLLVEKERNQAKLLEVALADQQLNIQDAQDDLDDMVMAAENQMDVGYGAQQQVGAPVVILDQPAPMHIPAPQPQVQQRQQHAAGQW